MTQKSPQGQAIIDYDYDVVGNRTQVTWPDGYSADYLYDDANRVTDILENGTISLASYSYDRRSRRASVTYGNGTNSSYSYEHDNDLATLDHGFLNKGVQFSFS